MRPPRTETAGRNTQNRERAARHDAFGGSFGPLAESAHKGMGDELTRMHMAPAQSVHERISPTDHPALADSMAFALERVFKVGP